MPDAITGMLAELLAHDDENMRGTAATGLSVMQTRAVSAMPALLRRLGEETNSDVGEALVRALSAIGNAAIPSLVAIIVDGDRARAEYAMRALAGTGTDAARTLAELLPSTKSDRVRQMIVNVLMAMGRAARPAIPVLAELFDETEDDDLALHAVISLCFCGPSAMSSGFNASATFGLIGTCRLVRVPCARFLSRIIRTPSSRFTSSVRMRINSLLRAPV